MYRVVRDQSTAKEEYNVITSTSLRHVGIPNPHRLMTGRVQMRQLKWLKCSLTLLGCQLTYGYIYLKLLVIDIFSECFYILDVKGG